MIKTVAQVTAKGKSRTNTFTAICMSVSDCERVPFPEILGLKFSVFSSVSAGNSMSSDITSVNYVKEKYKLMSSQPAQLVYLKYFPARIFPPNM